MDEVLAIALRGMQGDAARLDQIAMNVANGLTPGYKRGVLVQQPLTSTFAAHLASTQAVDAATPTFTPMQPVASVDLRPGTLRSTGQALDLALGGAGFFEVATPTGPAYTRGGTFHLDAQNRLMTQAGHVLAARGGAISVPTGAQVSVSATGLVTATRTGLPPQLLGQLKVVGLDKEAAIQRLGDGLLTASGAVRELADDEVQVRQGFLENSNVTSTHEMTALLQTMRHFESLQKAAQAYDDMLGTAIRRLTDNG